MAKLAALVTYQWGRMYGSVDVRGFSPKIPLLAPRLEVAGVSARGGMYAVDGNFVIVAFRFARLDSWSRLTNTWIRQPLGLGWVDAVRR